MSLSEQPYRELRARILDGRLEPGTPLKERDLCADLHVSRTPIREALRRLSADGLAEIRPGRSIIVARFDSQEIEEIFELGIVLESFVAGLAAAKATPDDIARLAAILDDMQKAVDAGPARHAAYIQLDRDFHEHLSAIARNRRVSDMLRQAVSFRVLLDVFTDYDSPDFATSLAQHRTILSAIEARDADWASAAMRTHIMTGRSVKSRRRAA